MSRSLTLSALVLTLSACGTLVGSGVSATEVRPVEGAMAFDARLWMDTVVRVGPASEITITCDDNLLDDAVTEVVDGVLILRQRTRSPMVRTGVDCQAVVELPLFDSIGNSGSGDMVLEGAFSDLVSIANSGSGDLLASGPLCGLETLDVNGSGSVDLAEVTCTSLSIDHDGSGDIDIADLDVEELDVRSGGSGQKQIAGTAVSAKITVTGSGDFGDRGLTVSEAELRLSGSGDVEMTVTERIIVGITGSGSATVFGQPEERDVSETGSGSVSFE